MILLIRLILQLVRQQHMPAGYNETVTVHSVNIVFFLSATEELFYFEFMLFGAHVVDALYQ